jgi:alpha-tubulin suppressor-like RCC1 family protein
VVAGRAHACVRLREGTPDPAGGAPPNVVCWGAGGQWQLGRGEGVVATAAPAPVVGLTEVVELSAGENHTCARRRDGSVRCWGDNSVGQLGDGTSTLRRAPVAAAFPGAALRVRAGGRHTCAVDSQEALYCWGDNRWGQLGDGSTSSLPAPLRVPGLTQVLEVAAGGDVTCALTRNSALLCWGDDRQGQLGVGSAATLAPAIAGREPPVVDDVIRISAGEAHTCALRTSGEALCWGAGQYGRLGEGRTEDRPAPVTVRLPAGLLEVRAGGAHSCGRTVDRTVWCWGRGDVGQLGTGELGDRPQPVQVRGLSAVDRLALGGRHSCALSRGRVLCWGAGDRGQNGQAATTPALEPAVVGGLEGVVEIAAGEAHTCARTGGTSIFCWGAGESGQLGGAPIPFRTTPAHVPKLTEEEPQALALGQRHSCFLSTRGDVSCWGDGSQGQLGWGEEIKSATTPLGVPGLSDVQAITAGANHSCARDGQGRLQCWGASDGVQNGSNSEPAKAVFSPAVVWSGPMSELTAGAAHTCFIDPTGGLAHCFGLDDHGQLGRDRLLLSSRPRSVALSCP